MKKGIIYCIENTVNNKKYIGKTIQKVNSRRLYHINQLKKGTHNNQHLQRAWDKYGETCFIFNILEECTQKTINKKEVYWIKKLNTTSREKGYNITKGGGGL